MIIDSIDAIESCVPGVRATGSKCFDKDDWLFSLRLQEQMVPGSLLIEMMMTTLSYCLRAALPPCSIYLAKVKTAKFLAPVLPGDLCLATAEVLARGEGFAQGKCTVRVRGEVVSESELLVSIHVGKAGSAFSPDRHAK